MAIDSRSPRSRRALLTAALGAGAASVLSALGRPYQAQAADGDSILLGVTGDNGALGTGLNACTAPTSIFTTRGGFAVTTASDWGNVAAIDGNATGTVKGNAGVRGTASGPGGRGVEGHAGSTIGSNCGVLGTSVSPTGYGVLAQNSYGGDGVRGESWGGKGVEGIAAAQFGPNFGVLGSSNSAQGYGVLGRNNAGGVGVRGETTTGVGVEAVATTGTALTVAGKAQFSRSGVVHATLQTYRSGVTIAAVRINYPTSGKARIYLTRVASTTANTYVGWFAAEY
jgi:hypothetical protein